MKVFIALCTLVVLACGVPQGRSRHHHLSQNVTELIAAQGYPVQNFTVQTTDGYMLDVVRIPGDKTFASQWENRADLKTNKPVVFLMHNLLSSAEDFIIGGPSEGLAYLLAHRGYDVFMGNSRGNIYARKHTQLNPESDAVFWRYCQDDIGKKDLPVMIDEILKMTGQNKLTYIGHMQGSTVFYIMASELPEYNNKIEKMISLGPVAYLKYATNTMLNTIALNQQSKPWQMKNIGVNEFHPSNDLMAIAGQDDCISMGINERICQNPFFLINGYESEKMNQTTALKYAQRLPAGASSRQILHLVHLLKSGRFDKNTESQQEIQEYHLEKITAPVALIYAPQDKITNEENVKLLASKLPNVIRTLKVNQMINNLDLVLGQNVETIVYDNVFDILKL